jgi:2-polyprenyl-3-methyl-5-hydroxy-6-metoxy-1,4-benzoquinol methylase
MNRDEASHLEEVYADSYFFEGKEGYPDYLQEKDILVQHGKFYAGIAGKYAQPGKMLDVGAAAGFIMQGFKDQGWDCAGIEPNKSMVEYCRDQLHMSNEQGSIENATYENQFDLVTLIQVIDTFMTWTGLITYRGA